MQQKRRQSLDFKEIWNIQTEMCVKQEDWDQIFHNWENPEQCLGRKRPEGCSICERLQQGNIPIVRITDGKIFYDINDR